MARGGLRVSEVLHFRVKDIEDQKLVIRDPKSIKETESAYIPQKLADRLNEYVRIKKIETEARIFPLSYAAARIMTKKAGKLVGIDPWPRPVNPIFLDNALKIKYFTNNDRLESGRTRAGWYPRFETTRSDLCQPIRHTHRDHQQDQTPPFESFDNQIIQLHPSKILTTKLSGSSTRFIHTEISSLK